MATRAAAKPKPRTRAAAKKASFWDNYQDEGGSQYLSAAEKQALIDNEVVIQITGVRFDEANQFQGAAAPRYVITVLVPDQLSGETEERLAGFAINPEGSSRDRLLEALEEYLETKEGQADEINVVLGKVGNFVTISKADA